MQERKRRTRHRKPYEPTDRDAILEAVYRHQISGLTIGEATKLVGVSPASYYRWQIAKQDGGRTADAEADMRKAENSRQLQRSIDLLSSKTPTPRLAFVLSAIRFSSWLNEPELGYNYSIMVLSLMSGYIRQSSRKNMLDGLDQEIGSLLAELIDLRFLEDLTSKVRIPSVDFDDYKIEGKPFTVRDAMAHVAWCLLGPALGDPPAGKPLNLAKAHFLLTKGGFRHRWVISASTFHRYWLQYGATSPFVYIELFESGLNWMLDPATEDFVGDVDSLVDDADGVRESFANCRWAIDRVAKLHPRTWDRFQTPTLPKELPMRQIEPKPLDSRAIAILQTYKPRFIVDYE